MSDDTDLPGRPFGMGLKRDEPDRRDRLLFRAVPNVDQLPDRPAKAPPLCEVMDQSVVGACTGFSTATLCHSVMVLDGHRRPFVPSPPFLYREGRVRGDDGGDVAYDWGAELRNVVKAANQVGLPPASNLPPRFRATDIADPQTQEFPVNSIWRKEPAKSHYADAARRKVLTYFKLPTLADLLRCLSDGYPAVVGFEVHRSFYGPGGPRYEVPDPQPERGDRALGGHAVCAYSYDKPSRRVLLRNSWGPDAHEGRPDFLLSFSNLERHGWDWWTVRYIQGGRPTS